ncbi:MAG TPA: glycoside hydrolase family 5 protein, partial [Bacteroidota bacterium]|nr:glycoside hydrolase family 5 protein [Bacteroidota bacterium]
MKKYFITMILVSFSMTTTANAQLTPQAAAQALGRGINIGNTFDAPSETAWGNPALTASNFDDYKNAGFTSVRIPITWDTHTSGTTPYSINKTFLDRIDTVVSWGLKRGLMIIINTHHESWIKDDSAYANPSKRARFDSIWSQIATRFQNRSDSLLFEIINEPTISATDTLSAANVNDLNAKALSVIRQTNPHRIVLFSGNHWSNSAELLAAAIPQDNYLIGYYHSYDPYPFGLLGTGTFGSMGDISAIAQKFNQVASWSSQHTVPAVLSEYGAIDTSDYNSRMCYYATVAQKALFYNVPFMAWEDGGDFKFYDRTQHTWTEVKDVIIHTYKESPNFLVISFNGASSVTLQWRNNTADDSGIVVERKVNNGNFADFAQLASTATSFNDSTATAGNSYYYRLRTNVKDSIIVESYPMMITIPNSTSSVVQTAAP